MQALCLISKKRSTSLHGWGAESWFRCISQWYLHFWTWSTSRIITKSRPKCSPWTIQPIVGDSWQQLLQSLFVDIQMTSQCTTWPYGPICEQTLNSQILAVFYSSSNFYCSRIGCSWYSLCIKHDSPAIGGTSGSCSCPSHPERSTTTKESVESNLQSLCCFFEVNWSKFIFLEPKRKCNKSQTRHVLGEGKDKEDHGDMAVKTKTSKNKRKQQQQQQQQQQ